MPPRYIVAAASSLRASGFSRGIPYGGGGIGGFAHSTVLRLPAAGNEEQWGLLYVPRTFEVARLIARVIATLPISPERISDRQIARASSYGDAFLAYFRPLG